MCVCVCVCWCRGFRNFIVIAHKIEKKPPLKSQGEKRQEVVSGDEKIRNRSADFWFTFYLSYIVFSLVEIKTIVCECMLQ